MNQSLQLRVRQSRKIRGVVECHDLPANQNQLRHEDRAGVGEQFSYKFLQYSVFVQQISKMLHLTPRNQALLTLHKFGKG
jgi:hypothetical protein